VVLGLLFTDVFADVDVFVGVDVFVDVDEAL
jgi:hypothetical protein